LKFNCTIAKKLLTSIFSGRIDRPSGKVFNPVFLSRQPGKKSIGRNYEMTWGNQTATAETKPVATACEYPGCGANAHVFISFNGDKLASCVEHSKDQTIVGLVEGSGVDETISKRLIAQWDEAKAILERAKNSEMEARLMVGNYMFPLAGRKEGVNNEELSDGRVAKLGHKVNYKLKGDNDKIDEVIERCEGIGNEGAFLIERIISWEAKFSAGEYKKLEADNPTHQKVKKEIDTILEISNGTPSLEIREPKAKLNG
jgi:hypothetical protein